jgi:hypothetical protein
MKFNAKSFSGFLTLVLALTLVSCSESGQINREVQDRPNSPDLLGDAIPTDGSEAIDGSETTDGSQATPSPITTSLVDRDIAAIPHHTGPIEVVQIYSLDNHCEAFVPESVSVPQAQGLEIAVDQVIADRQTGDFSIANYQVIRDEQAQRATIEFSLADDSPRGFISLSSCEQMALFGSLRQTLTQNPQWNIDQVQFTHQGEEIAL